MGPSIERCVMKRTKTIWNSVKFSDEFEEEVATSCCGVLELKDISDVFNTEIRGDFYDDLGYESDEYRGATYPEILKAFKSLEEDWKENYGMVVVYLLPEQAKGTMGKLVKSCEWTSAGKFWNPGTRNTLQMFFKKFNRTAPRVSKKTKRRF